MNPLHGLAIVVLGSILLQFGTVEAIQCYVCQSHLEPDCGHKLSAKFLKNCSDNAQGPNFIACRKIDNSIQSKYLGRSVKDRITRQCATATKDKKGSFYTRSGFGSTSHVHECYDNGCNAGTTILVNAMVMMLVPFVAFYNHRT